MKVLLLYPVGLTGIISVWQRRKPVSENPRHHVFKVSIQTYTCRDGAMLTCHGVVALLVAPNSPLTDGVTLGNA